MSHTLFSCQRKLSISLASLPHSGRSSGSLILLSGVIYERCKAELLHAYSTCWCWRIRAKAAAREGNGRKRDSKKGRTGLEKEPKSETLYEKERIRGSQKQSGGKYLTAGGVARGFVDVVSALTDHTPNDGCYTVRQNKQTSDEQALINSVVQLQT